MMLFFEVLKCGLCFSDMKDKFIPEYPEFPVGFGHIFSDREDGGDKFHVNKG